MAKDPWKCYIHIGLWSKFCKVYWPTVTWNRCLRPPLLLFLCHCVDTLVVYGDSVVVVFFCASLLLGLLGTNQRLFVFFQAASDALSSLGHVYMAIGDYPNSLASHKQCVLLARQTQCQLAEARQLGNMGAVYTALGDFTNAVQCHEQHLSIAKVQYCVLCGVSRHPFF